MSSSVNFPIALGFNTGYFSPEVYHREVLQELFFLLSRLKEGEALIQQLTHLSLSKSKERCSELILALHDSKWKCLLEGTKNQTLSCRFQQTKKLMTFLQDGDYSSLVKQHQVMCSCDMPFRPYAQLCSFLFMHVVKDWKSLETLPKSDVVTELTNLHLVYNHPKLLDDMITMAEKSGDPRIVKKFQFVQEALKQS
jgi:hypothetical protein